MTLTFFWWNEYNYFSVHISITRRSFAGLLNYLNNCALIKNWFLTRLKFSNSPQLCMKLASNTVQRRGTLQCDTCFFWPWQMTFWSTRFFEALLLWLLFPFRASLHCSIRYLQFNPVLTHPPLPQLRVPLIVLQNVFTWYLLHPEGDRNHSLGRGSP